MSKAIEKRLKTLTAELVGLRHEVVVLDEQIEHFRDVADEARMRSMVAETPQLQNEAKQASRTLEVMVKNRTEILERITRLETKQDALLDALSERLPIGPSTHYLRILEQLLARSLMQCSVSRTC